MNENSPADRYLGYARLTHKMGANKAATTTPNLKDGPTLASSIERSTSPEILNQAAQTAEFNKALRAQRSSRERYLNDYWKRPHEVPVASPSTIGSNESQYHTASHTTSYPFEDEIANMRLQIDGLLREKEQWLREQMETRQIIDQLHWDKEELVRSHMLETGELRKKVVVLTERLEATSTTTTSVTPARHSVSSYGQSTTSRDNDSKSQSGSSSQQQTTTQGQSAIFENAIASAIFENAIASSSDDGAPPATAPTTRQQLLSGTYETGAVGISKETEPVLCIKYTISEDMTKGEQARNKARLSAIADRPMVSGSKRSSVLGFAHSRTGIEAHRNHGTLLLKDRSGFSLSSREDLQKKALPNNRNPYVT